MLWDPQFSVQLAELDAQHEYFFSLLDQVEAASKVGARDRLPALLEELLRYTKYHFTSEEALMDSYEFPGAAHREEHANLVQRAETMLVDPGLRPSVLRIFLYKWIVNHIQLSDVELAQFVVNRRRDVEPNVAPGNAFVEASRR